MPVLNQLPSARSGFDILKPLLKSNWTVHYFEDNGTDIVTFDIYQKSLFWFFDKPLVKVKIFDASVNFYVHNNSIVPRLEQIAKEFERIDPRRVTINYWK